MAQILTEMNANTNFPQALQHVKRDKYDYSDTLTF